jgi:hypothetical protein
MHWLLWNTPDEKPPRSGFEHHLANGPIRQQCATPSVIIINGTTLALSPYVAVTTKLTFEIGQQ